MEVCSHPRRDDSFWRSLEVTAQFPLICTKNGFFCPGLHVVIFDLNSYSLSGLHGLMIAHHSSPYSALFCFPFAFEMIFKLKMEEVNEYGRDLRGIKSQHKHQNMLKYWGGGVYVCLSLHMFELIYSLWGFETARTNQEVKKTKQNSETVFAHGEKRNQAN